MTTILRTLKFSSSFILVSILTPQSFNPSINKLVRLRYKFTKHLLKEEHSMENVEGNDRLQQPDLLQQ